MTKDVNLVGLDYFKPSGKYYSSGYFEAPEGALLDEVCQMVKKRMRARELPGLAGGHSLFDVVVTYKGVPALISAATQPREPEPKACPACKGEPESGFIEMDNNGPIVPCRTCNSDPESCADVPSLRHCEAANRETATQPPQVAEDYTEDKDVFEYLREKQALGYFTHPAIVKLMRMAPPPQATDAQRKAALDAVEVLKKHRTPDGYLLRQFMPEHWKAIEAALTAPAVTDDELRKAVEDATEHLSICQPNRHRSAVETLIRAATHPPEVFTVEEAKYHFDDMGWNDIARLYPNGLKIVEG